MIPIETDNYDPRLTAFGVLAVPRLGAMFVPALFWSLHGRYCARSS